MSELLKAYLLMNEKNCPSLKLYPDDHKPIQEISNEQLISFLYLDRYSALSFHPNEIICEVLKRMNDVSPLLPIEEIDWGNPITP